MVYTAARKILRPIYLRARNVRGRKITIGGIKLRIPAEMKYNMLTTEPKTTGAFVDWIREHPSSLVIDVGSSIGMYSALALFADPSAKVVAVDSSLGALAKVHRFCRYATGSRLQTVWAFIVDHSESYVNLAKAVSVTESALQKGGALPISMITLVSDDIAHIPRYTLDSLLKGIRPTRHMLIKCDIEGAELLMLRGAESLLRKARPSIFLSVHNPEMLSAFGHTRNKIDSYLRTLGYRTRVLEVDVEEHWLCEPT